MVMTEEFNERDTDEVDVQEAILKELQSIGRGLKEVTKRIEHLEERVEQVVTDLTTVHSLQRTYTSRLAVLEQMCVDQPLATSTPVPMKMKGGDGKR